MMQLEVLATADQVARKAASRIASAARDAVAARGSFTLAVSGGRTPWIMLRMLAKRKLPWSEVQVLQVDERVAPRGHADRNLTHLQRSLLETTPLSEAQLHAMPVETPDLDAAVKSYAATLRAVAGDPPRIDLIHLGMGPDGHTASLVPGDAVLDISDREVGLTAGAYQGRRRMTLTYPAINRARRILWLVTGADKASTLPRLVAGDPSIPAGRVAREHAWVLADADAATGEGA